MLSGLFCHIAIANLKDKIYVRVCANKEIDEEIRKFTCLLNLKICRLHQFYVDNSQSR